MLNIPNSFNEDHRILQYQNVKVKSIITFSIKRLDTILQRNKHSLKLFKNPINQLTYRFLNKISLVDRKHCLLVQ